MVKLTINGKKIEASPDKTILQVCHEQDLDQIPTLCYDEKLEPFGSCFLCVVEVGGQNKLFTACSTKVTAGMVVNTKSDRIRRPGIQIKIDLNPGGRRPCRSRNGSGAMIWKNCGR